MFCSRFGTTGDIILKIAETIRTTGNIDHIRNLKDIDKEDIPDVRQYDGIIIGTGIKMGRWTKEITNFLSDYDSVLHTNYIPLAIFATSGKASNPKNYESAKKMYVTDKIKNSSLNIVITDVFPGVLDLSRQSPFNWFERRIVWAMRREIPQIKAQQKNDFRNWSKIESFTKYFIQKYS